MPPGDAPHLEAWLSTLERRMLADLSFAEVRRALQALSARYVSAPRPAGRFDAAAALEGAGKRAAFALFYAPLHLITVREIVRALGERVAAPRRIVDLGCGTGAASAGWALAARDTPRIDGVDRSAWAVDEAASTWRSLGLDARAHRGDLMHERLPGRGAGILVAYAANELDDGSRARLLEKLTAALERGASVLVIEPIARRGVGWWGEWCRAFEPFGGRADTWRFTAALPEIVRRLDRAAGLDHRELTARSLWGQVSH